MKCDKTKQSVIIDLRRAETRSDLPRWNPANRSVLYPSLTRPFSDDDDGDDDDDAFLEISHKPKNMETDRNEKTPDQEERVWSSETHTRAHTHTHTYTHGPTERSSPKKSTLREKDTVVQSNILPQGEADAQVSSGAIANKVSPSVPLASTIPTETRAR